MWTVSESDFEKLKAWGTERDPFAAVKDYSIHKEEYRWLNPNHVELWKKYVQARLNYIAGKSMINYFKNAQRTIERDRWEFLKLRKSWYIMPLGWDNFLTHNCRIADFGSGDGDCLQRISEYIEGESDKKRLRVSAELFGLDINETRVKNAQELVRSRSGDTKFTFLVADVIGKPIAFEDDFFDFSLANGFFEILDETDCVNFARELSRVTKKGIYIQDIAEPFPGGWPRERLETYFKEYGFELRDRKVILSEPFGIEGSKDPKELFPMIRVQNLWLERSR